MQLVEEKEMSRISVSELSAKAVVNRSTFYLHYDDVAAVAEDIELEISESIASCIEDFTFTDVYGSAYILFKKLTKRLEENSLMKRYIIFSTNSEHVIARLKAIFLQMTMASIMNNFPSLSEVTVSYYLTYATAGIIDSYVRWVRNNEEMTLEESIRYVSELTELIISNLTKKQ